jgi:hypothetical protein
MPFSIEFIDNGDWITAVVTGRLDSREVFLRYFDVILQRLLSSGVRRVLVDNRGVTIFIDVFDATQAVNQLVEDGVPALGISYAGLFTESMVEDHSYFETVFRNNSFRGRVFSDEAQAVEWLTS